MKKLIVGNWKMNPASLSEGLELGKNISSQNAILAGSDAEIVLCPPFPFINAIHNEICPRIALGAQTVGEDPTGAHTGEISALMIKSVGADFVIIGHSERRKKYHESNAVFTQQIMRAIEAGLTPIFCVGETQEERAAGLTEKVIAQQLSSLYDAIIRSTNEINIAYEPVWAIGTGNACDFNAAEEVRLIIKNFVETPGIGTQEVRFLYGGSVLAKNSQDYLFKALFDGLLVGGASLNPDEFLNIIASARQ